MHKPSSPAPPDSLGLIVREYLKALWPEFSERIAGHERPGRRPEETNAARKNALFPRPGGYAPELGQRFVVR